MAIRITQAGMALTVGIIIVTGLIIGGFFIVKNSGEQARRDEAISIANQNLEQEVSEEAALNEGDSAESEAAVEEDAPTDTDETASTQEALAAERAAQQAQQAQRAAEQAANELPQTGPLDQLSGVVVLSVLTFTVASYVTSRRQL